MKQSYTLDPSELKLAVYEFMQEHHSDCLDDEDEGIEVEFTEGESGTEAIVHVGLEWETKGSEAFEDEDAEEEEDDEEEDAESAAA